MSDRYYVASCLFTARLPKTSLAIQNYVANHTDFHMVRCCMPNFKVRQNTERIPDAQTRAAWEKLPTAVELRAGDTVYTVCHHCPKILSEQHEGLNLVSLWEWIDQDPAFPFPDYSGMKVTIQDCWRSRDRLEEQIAVRHLLERMNIETIETEENYANTEFCGNTRYRGQPVKTVKFASAGTGNQLQPEQVERMQEYCSRFTTDTVVCYCHYCLEGLQQGGIDARHIAQLLFPD